MAFEREVEKSPFLGGFQPVFANLGYRIKMDSKCNGLVYSNIIKTGKLKMARKNVRLFSPLFPAGRRVLPALRYDL